MICGCVLFSEPSGPIFTGHIRDIQVNFKLVTMRVTAWLQLASCLNIVSVLKGEGHFELFYHQFILVTLAQLCGDELEKLAQLIEQTKRVVFF